MLIRRDDDGSAIVIGQASHAWMSGQMAAGWAEPVPEVVRLAAEQHDIGWMEWDNAPRLNPATGFPYLFLELPRDEHVSLWRGSAKRLLSQSRYATLLVSMHGTGLYERYPPKDVGDEVQAAIDEYLESERAFQTALREELAPDPEQLARDSALIAAWDWLSLGLCLKWAPRRMDGFALLETTIEPWPFRERRVVLTCEGRRLDGPVGNQAELEAALARAPAVELRFELKAQ
jgi:hypothetical protein